MYLVMMLIVVTFVHPVSGQLAGSAHDFSSKTWAPADNNKCGVCHATHNAKNEPSAPLWNHQSTAVATYTLYSSPTFNGSGTITNPSASSKLCLSCHDGTVALENFGGTTTGTNYILTVNKVGNPTGDISKEHPISFDYTTALATTDGSLNDPSTTAALGGTIATKMLFANKMECASCHDVHNKYNVAHLLKMANNTSQLCLTCHSK
ncbi:MAG: cytochrome C [Bacteroidetes bacterium]|nr:MAG: cytochrome C [Bacteroidota bacterium]